MGRRAIPALILIVETGLAAYIALVVWLSSVWMIDDSQAARMVPSDWYIEAVRRFGAGIAVAFVFGALVYSVNRRSVAASAELTIARGGRSAPLPVLHRVGRRSRSDSVCDDKAVYVSYSADGGDAAG